MDVSAIKSSNDINGTTHLNARYARYIVFISRLLQQRCQR